MTAWELVLTIYGAGMTFLFVALFVGYHDLFDRHTAMVRNEIAAEYAREWDDLAAEDQALFIVSEPAPHNVVPMQRSER